MGVMMLSMYGTMIYFRNGEVEKGSTCSISMQLSHSLVPKIQIQELLSPLFMSEWGL